jgi:hypothetical protein
VLVTADNNLFRLVDSELAELRTADPRRVKLVVQTDTPQQRAERHVTNDDGTLFLLRKRRFATDRNLNSGSVSVLRNFLVASRRLRTGDATALILNGHGTGIMRFPFPPLNGNGDGNGWKPAAYAFATDDSARDFLDNNEFESAMRATIREEYAIIGCDACLMAMVEVAHQLKEFGRYFVASQDNEAADGWPYRTILTKFGDDQDPEAVATAMVDAYRETTVTNPLATLSAVDLHQMDDLADDLNELGAALSPLVATQLRPIALARRSARAFANFDSIDLCGFVQGIKTEIGNSTADALDRRKVIDAADQVLSTMDIAVKRLSKHPAASRANGLSIYLPNAPVIPAYDDLPLSKQAPSWHKFVSDYGAADRSTL